VLEGRLKEERSNLSDSTARPLTLAPPSLVQGHMGRLLPISQRLVVLLNPLRPLLLRPLRIHMLMVNLRQAALPSLLLLLALITRLESLLPLIHQTNLQLINSRLLGLDPLTNLRYLRMDTPNPLLLLLLLGWVQEQARQKLPSHLLRLNLKLKLKRRQRRSCPFIHLCLALCRICTRSTLISWGLRVRGVSISRSSPRRARANKARV
jgi:hypothetical protein